MFTTPTAIVTSLAALMGAATTPVYSQDPAQSELALLATRGVGNKITGGALSLRELLSPPADNSLATQALLKDHRNLRREAMRDLQQEVVEIPPETSGNADGVKVADFEAMLQQELVNLEAYVGSPEFDENEAAAYQEGERDSL